MAKILVVDNDRVVLFTLVEGLRKFGFDVIEARDGLQALQLCQEEAPDLVLLDTRLPGLNGMDVARRLRDNTTPPFLFLSACDEEAYIKEAKKIGAFGYIIKPTSVDTIIPIIREALARSQDVNGLHGVPTNNHAIAPARGMLACSTH